MKLFKKNSLKNLVTQSSSEVFYQFMRNTTIRAVGTIVAMAATLFNNYLTCDIQNALIKLAALQYTFLWPCFLMIIGSLSCYSMRDLMGLVARSIIKIIITDASS